MNDHLDDELVSEWAQLRESFDPADEDQLSEAFALMRRMRQAIRRGHASVRLINAYDEAQISAVVGAPDLQDLA